MYITTSVILILTLLTNGIQCPGAGGGRGEPYRDREEQYHGRGEEYYGSGEHYRGKGEQYHGRERTNTGGNRDNNHRSISSVIGIIVTAIIISIVVCIICCVVCCLKRNTTSKQNNNKEPVDPTASPKVLSEANPFQTGIWAFRYHQYDKWYGPYRLLLTFDHQLWQGTGKGADDLGSFICDGIYSPEDRRLNLTLRYDEDTGNPEENLGHTSTIELHWNSTKNIFAGKWHVRTATYTDEDKFEMEFKEHTEPLLKPDYLEPTLEVKVT